jgi:hypothetical protein
MDHSRLTVLRAASNILSEKRPDRRSVEVLTAYADANLPGTETLPLDELATVVALKLMGIEGDPTGRNSK